MLQIIIFICFQYIFFILCFKYLFFSPYPKYLERGNGLLEITHLLLIASKHWRYQEGYRRWLLTLLATHIRSFSLKQRSSNPFRLIGIFKPFIWCHVIICRSPAWRLGVCSKTVCTAENEQHINKYKHMLP